MKVWIHWQDQHEDCMEKKKKKKTNPELNADN